GDGEVQRSGGADRERRGEVGSMNGGGPLVDAVTNGDVEDGAIGPLEVARADVGVERSDVEWRLVVISPDEVSGVADALDGERVRIARGGTGAQEALIEQREPERPVAQPIGARGAGHHLLHVEVDVAVLPGAPGRRI